jgi:hypothetical protein
LFSSLRQALHFSSSEHCDSFSRQQPLVPSCRTFALATWKLLYFPFLIRRPRTRFLRKTPSSRSLAAGPADTGLFMLVGVLQHRISHPTIASPIHAPALQQKHLPRKLVMPFYDLHHSSTAIALHARLITGRRGHPWFTWNMSFPAPSSLMPISYAASQAARVFCSLAAASARLASVRHSPISRIFSRGDGRAVIRCPASCSPLQKSGRGLLQCGRLTKPSLEAATPVPRTSPTPKF